MNNMGTCNKIRSREKSAIEFKGGRHFLQYSQEAVLREGRLVVVVFHELSKRRGIAG